MKKVKKYNLERAAMLTGLLADDYSIVFTTPMVILKFE
jgi:hypothetical protein